ncbi:hypothetical protein KEM54_006303 [Ascosphaera aggregata]|nr:hypothetical protein KEM54_006303 [Ascosphaera aggregata]
MSSSRSRSSSIDSLFDDEEGEYDYMLSNPASPGQAIGPVRTRDRNRSPPSISPLGTTIAVTAATRPTQFESSDALKPVRRKDRIFYSVIIVDGRPDHPIYPEERILKIFETFQKYKSRHTNRYFNERDIKKDFLNNLDDLRVTDMRNRPELQAKLLDRNTGLWSIVEDDDCPDWVKDDIEVLLGRWRRGDWDPYPFRGMELRRNITTGNSSRAEDPKFRFKRAANVVGDKHLRNGQWWPYRLSMLRDGAHGSSEGGIAGNEMVGAVSCILGGGSSDNTGIDYPDKDDGDVVDYCSTANRSGTMTTNTKLMIRAHNRNTPIRLFRGARLGGKYAPKEGFRYDGLYRIISHELVHPETKLYRFRMKRLPGQTPIRWHGVELRPTAREVQHFNACRNKEDERLQYIRRISNRREASRRTAQ